MNDNHNEDEGEMIDMSSVDKRTLPAYLTAPIHIGLALGDEAEDWLYEFSDAQDVTWFSGNEPVSVCVDYVRRVDACHPRTARRANPMNALRYAAALYFAALSVLSALSGVDGDQVIASSYAIAAGYLAWRLVPR